MSLWENAEDIIERACYDKHAADAECKVWVEWVNARVRCGIFLKLDENYGVNILQDGPPSAGIFP